MSTFGGLNESERRRMREQIASLKEAKMGASRFCGNCGVQWEDHDDDYCIVGWLLPEFTRAHVTRGAA